MGWPLPNEFNEAVQNPGTAFADDDLRCSGVVVGAAGLLLPRSGNFADVYHLHGGGRQGWAVKCFTRSVPGLAERYAAVSAALERAALPFTVEFRYLAEGVRVGGAWWPVVKMEWVDGLLLNEVVRDEAGRPDVLGALGQMWVRLCHRLRVAGLAHGDLQHGNVLLVPGPSGHELKLVDYDGMWTPALAHRPPGESGHPSFQHPSRNTTGTFSPDVDRFPHLVIATALLGSSLGGRALWGRYDNGDNLLFNDSDFQNPPRSEVLRELWRFGHPGLQSLVGHLAIACGKPISQTPWLDQIVSKGEPVPLDGATRREAVRALGLGLTIAIPDSSPAAVSTAPVPAFELVPEQQASGAVLRAASPVGVSTPTSRLNLIVPDKVEPERSSSGGGQRKAGLKPNRIKEKTNTATLLWAVAAGLVVGSAGVISVVMVVRAKPAESVSTKSAPPAETVSPPSALKPSVRVVNAIWGAGNRNVDVTERVAGLLAQGEHIVVDGPGLGPDPAPNIMKTLRLKLQIGEEVLEMSIPDRGELRLTPNR